MAGLSAGSGCSPLGMKLKSSFLARKARFFYLCMNYKKIQLSVFLGVAIFSFSFQGALASEVNKENIIDLANYSRVKGGLSALAENSKLNEAAMEKAKDMLQNNYFAHTSPQEKSPWFWFEKVKYDYLYAGENLAINFKTAEDEHVAWMESADHKKNILNPKYQEIGVAVQKGIIDNKTALVTVQLFGARKDFPSILGEAAQKDSLALLNRELESDPWGQLAFVNEPTQEIMNSEKDSSPQYAIGKLTGINSDRLVNILQASGAITLMVIMIINPILVAGLFWKRQKKIGDNSDIAYPIKVVLAK